MVAHFADFRCSLCRKKIRQNVPCFRQSGIRQNGIRQNGIRQKGTYLTEDNVDAWLGFGDTPCSGSLQRGA